MSWLRPCRGWMPVHVDIRRDAEVGDEEDRSEHQPVPDWNVHVAGGDDLLERRTRIWRERRDDEEPW